MFEGTKKYIRTVLQPDSKDSLKSLVMFGSFVIMCVLSAVVCGCLITEVILNGHLVTSLIDCGVFECLLGGMVLGTSTAKIITDKAKINNAKMNQIADLVNQAIDARLNRNENYD